MVIYSYQHAKVVRNNKNEITHSNVFISFVVRLLIAFSCFFFTGIQFFFLNTSLVHQTVRASEQAHTHTLVKNLNLYRFVSKNSGIPSIPPIFSFWNMGKQMMRRIFAKSLCHFFVFNPFFYCPSVPRRNLLGN